MELRKMPSFSSLSAVIMDTFPTRMRTAIRERIEAASATVDSSVTCRALRVPEVQPLDRDYTYGRNRSCGW